MVAASGKFHEHSSDGYDGAQVWLLAFQRLRMQRRDAACRCSYLLFIDHSAVAKSKLVSKIAYMGWHASRQRRRLIKRKRS